jgi:hypothetical protein
MRRFSRAQTVSRLRVLDRVRDIEGSPKVYTREEIELHRRFIVFGESQIKEAGIGLFLAEDVSAGTVIGTMRGDRLAGDVAPGIHDLLVVEDGAAFYERLRGPLRFANHSDRPNLHLCRKPGRTVVSAARDVGRGEEVFWDYTRIADGTEHPPAFGALQDLGITRLPKPEIRFGRVRVKNLYP